MNPEQSTVPQLAAEYTTSLEESAKFGFLVRDTDLQRAEVARLEQIKDRIKGFKYGARLAGNDRAANALFHMQSGLNAQISFIDMWIRLKEGRYHEAWDRLIDAEQYVSIAMRADEGGVGLAEFLRRLRAAEEVIFPAFSLYNSWGVVIRGGKCSICGKAFSECEHVEGLVYCGALCLRISPDFVEMDHVALVEEPRDRRCIITEITQDGHYIDYMTLRQIRRAEEPENGVAGRMTVKIFHNNLPEID